MKLSDDSSQGSRPVREWDVGKKDKEEFDREERDRNRRKRSSERENRREKDPKREDRHRSGSDSPGMSYIPSLKDATIIQELIFHFSSQG